MVYETTAGRNTNPFLLSFLTAFLKGSDAMVVEAILFDCGYAASGNCTNGYFLTRADDGRRR